MWAVCCECVQTCSTAPPSGDRKWDTDEVWWDAEPLHCWFVRLLRARCLSGLHYLLPDGRKRFPGKRCYHGGLVWNLILRLQSPTSLLHDRMWKLTWISAWGPSLQGIFQLFIYLLWHPTYPLTVLSSHCSQRDSCKRTAWIPSPFCLWSASCSFIFSSLKWERSKNSGPFFQLSWRQVCCLRHYQVWCNARKDVRIGTHDIMDCFPHCWVAGCVAASV